MVAPLKVGIAGLGTVGAEVVRLIEAQSKVRHGALRSQNSCGCGYGAIESQKALESICAASRGPKPRLHLRMIRTSTASSN